MSAKRQSSLFLFYFKRRRAWGHSHSMGEPHSYIHHYFKSRAKPSRLLTRSSLPTTHPKRPIPEQEARGTIE